jgi:undecaprenyl-diphosphatase
MEWVQHVLEADRDLFLFLNGFHNQVWDNIMVMVSGMMNWVPLYAIVFFYFFKNFKPKGFRILIILMVLILTGLVFTFLTKETFHRLRPNHDPALYGLVHSIGRVGLHGFVSSHSFNTVAAYIYSSLVFRNRLYSSFLLVWCALVAYSRIYLGVHYPLDILGGAILGSLAGWLAYTILIGIEKRKITNSSPLTAETKLSYRQARDILFIFGANLLVFFCISLVKVYFSS